VAPDLKSGLSFPRAFFARRQAPGGFIVTPDGTILTNAHVIDGADEVIVKLADKREFKAKVLGARHRQRRRRAEDRRANLPTVKIGTAANTRVGEWVLAIGSPFGFESSASAGIVSAKSRSLPDAAMFRSSRPTSR
jgi:serine protease Do